MALHILQPTGTRTLLLEDHAFGGGAAQASRRGLAGPDYPNQHLAGHDAVTGLSEPVQDSAHLTTLVGVYASSQDFRAGLRLVRRTTNLDQRLVGAVRFAHGTFGSLSADTILAAELHYRQAPWGFDGWVQDNTEDGCMANKVAQAYRLSEPLEELQGSLQAATQAWPVTGSAAQPLEAGPTGLDVTDIVRGWHRDSRATGRRHQGNLLLLPALPSLLSGGLRSVPIAPNRRRRTHWVRESRWRVGPHLHEFRCMAQLTGIYILMHTRD